MTTIDATERAAWLASLREMKAQLAVIPQGPYSLGASPTSSAHEAAVWHMGVIERSGGPKVYCVTAADDRVVLTTGNGEHGELLARVLGGLLSVAPDLIDLFMHWSETMPLEEAQP